MDAGIMLTMIIILVGKIWRKKLNVLHAKNLYSSRNSLRELEDGKQEE